MRVLRDPAFLALVGAMAAAIVFFFRSRRQAPALLAAAGAFDLFVGLLSFALVALHLGAVLGRALSGRGLGGAPSFSYNFRFYSLILVGVLIAVPGLLAALSARGVSRGNAEAWKRALRSSLLLLAVDLPLAPIQGFAIGLSGLALLNLAGLAAVRKRFAAGSGR